MIARLAIVDDHPLVREGVAAAFADETEFVVAAVGGSAHDAVTIVEQERVDLMLLDINMPGGGLAAVRRIALMHNRPRIIMFSIRRDAETVRACFEAGADGYVVKGATGAELRAAARRVLSGAVHLDPALDGLPIACRPATE